MQKFNKISTLTICMMVAFGSIAFSQEKKVLTDKEKAEAYTQTITKRSDNIVKTLGITDSSKYYKVREIMVNQYRTLNETYEARNAKIKEIKTKPGADKASIDTLVKKTNAETAVKVKKLHDKYISKLSSQLNTEQVEKIKDGMTYGKVAFTYGGYINMIPTLTDEQKTKIKGWLIEARELAMDAESADKKTEIFGKYKGRIANYLSSQGYDMKKEGENWKNRRTQEAEDAKTKK